MLVTKTNFNNFTYELKLEFNRLNDIQKFMYHADHMPWEHESEITVIWPTIIVESSEEFILVVYFNSPYELEYVMKCYNMMLESYNVNK